MAVDHIRYDLLTQEAMRGVVRRVLKDAAVKGLAGEHHFFISFATRSPGVKLSPRLQAQYAEEMTIVLQHQFWDLNVTDDAFEVGLSFNGIPERLTVPFAAIKGFFDPSVNFGLQFAPGRSSGDEVEPQKLTPAAENTPVEESGKPAPPSDSRRKTLPGPTEVAAPADEDPDKPSGGAEVVRLDRFRKK
ncbi:MAG: hypothetical protein JO134_10985 [Xanthobacteraceae bacterium]|nr:hypothetical protein [Xanthobacteraceae bacterium]